MTLPTIGEAFGNHKHATGVRGRCAQRSPASYWLAAPDGKAEIIHVVNKPGSAILRRRAGR